MGLSFQNARVSFMFPKKRAHNLERWMYSWNLIFSSHFLPFRFSLAGNIAQSTWGSISCFSQLALGYLSSMENLLLTMGRKNLLAERRKSQSCMFHRQFLSFFFFFFDRYTYRIQRCRCCWDYYCGRLPLPQCYIVMGFKELTEDTLINVANTCKPIDDRFYHCWIPR